MRILQVRDEVPSDLQFVMEDIAGDEKKAGITWYVIGCMLLLYLRLSLDFF
jgi:hypothetical protein